MVHRALPTELRLSIATMPPTKRDRWFAVAFAAILFVTFAAMVPFAAKRLGGDDAFIPSVQAVIFVTDFLTAVLLYVQYRITGSSALLALAGGYLFSALMVIPYTLSFPSSSAPIGLIGGGIQTAPWLFIFWHLGLPISVIIYVGLKPRRLTEWSGLRPRVREVFSGLIVVLSLVFIFTWLAREADILLPRMNLPDGTLAQSGYLITYLLLSICILALTVLLVRLSSVLDLWILVALCSLILELARAVFVVVGRFTVGFYFSRIFAVVVSTVVLIALLSETIKLYINLARSIRQLLHERESRLMNSEAVVAAIAHEVRQPMTGIALQSAAGRRFLRQTPPDIDKAARAFSQIERASFAADQVFESIRALFRSADYAQKLIDINELTTEVLELLRRDLDACQVKTYVRLAVELPLIKGHKGQLQEVILNLIQNSIEAMNTTIEERRLLRIQSERHGSEEIAVSVEDSGPGIEPGRIATIFDTFVSTKAKGMGLGLAISKMIIERHGGQLSVLSEPGKGARFVFVLPQ